MEVGIVLLVLPVAQEVRHAGAAAFVGHGVVLHLDAVLLVALFLHAGGQHVGIDHLLAEGLVLLGGLHIAGGGLGVDIVALEANHIGAAGLPEDLGPGAVLHLALVLLGPAQDHLGALALQIPLEMVRQDQVVLRFLGPRGVVTAGVDADDLAVEGRGDVLGRIGGHVDRGLRGGGGRHGRAQSGGLLHLRRGRGQKLVLGLPGGLHGGCGHDLLLDGVAHGLHHAGTVLDGPGDAQIQPRQQRQAHQAKQAEPDGIADAKDPSSLFDLFHGRSFSFWDGAIVSSCGGSVCRNAKG